MWTQIMRKRVDVEMWRTCEDMSAQLLEVWRGTWGCVLQRFRRRDRRYMRVCLWRFQRHGENQVISAKVIIELFWINLSLGWIRALLWDPLRLGRARANMNEIGRSPNEIGLESIMFESLSMIVKSDLVLSEFKMSIIDLIWDLTVSHPRFFASSLLSSLLPLTSSLQASCRKEHCCSSGTNSKTKWRNRCEVFDDDTIGFIARKATIRLACQLALIYCFSPVAETTTKA